MMTPPEFFARSTLSRYAHSALPGAPLRPARARRRGRAAVGAVARLAGRRRP
jgi:hypothetical protein